MFYLAACLFHLAAEKNKPLRPRFCPQLFLPSAVPSDEPLPFFPSFVPLVVAMGAHKGIKFDPERALQQKPDVLFVLEGLGSPERWPSLVGTMV